MKRSSNFMAREISGLNTHMEKDKKRARTVAKTKLGYDT
jgi:hypothetical protein